MAYQKLQSREALPVITSDKVRIPDPSTVIIINNRGSIKGTGSFTSGTTLVGNLTAFLGKGIEKGMIVYNFTDKIAYHVVSVDNDTEITLSGGGAGGAASTFAIYARPTIGCTLFVGTAGDLTVQMAENNGNTNVVTAPANAEVLYKNITNASFLPIQVVRVDKTSTTADDIVAMW